MISFKAGDYVMASKYNDGDPQDHWCVGFYAKTNIYERFNQIRHIVVNEKNEPFRANGFRRCAHISKKRGNWIVEHASFIEQHRFNVWHWHRASWEELHTVDKRHSNEQI